MIIMTLCKPMIGPSGRCEGGLAAGECSGHYFWYFFFFSLVLTCIAFTPEGFVVGFSIFAWVPK